MQASKWEIVADENEGELPSGMLARFVTGSRVAGTDCQCGVVAVEVLAQDWLWNFVFGKGTCAQ